MGAQMNHLDEIVLLSIQNMIKYVVGAQKNQFNEMVLLSIQNMLKLINKNPFAVLRSQTLIL